MHEYLLFIITYVILFILTIKYKQLPHLYYYFPLLLTTRCISFMIYSYHNVYYKLYEIQLSQYVDYKLHDIQLSQYVL